MSLDLTNGSTPFRYVDHGKVFLTSARGAHEYSFLNRSDDRIASETESFYLKEIAVLHLRNKSFFASRSLGIGNVSVAFISWDIKGYLFIQLQQRREDEFIEKGVPRETQRPFNQARFVYFPQNLIELYLQQKLAPYSHLVYENENPNYSVDSCRLKDYIFPDRGEVAEWRVEARPLPVTDKNTEFLTKLVNAIYDQSRPGLLVNDIAPSRNPAPLMIVKTDIGIKEKIRLIDVAQYWLYPALGVITFALDYITDSRVVLCLYSEAPTRQLTTEMRVFDENSLKSAPFEDYLGAVQSLSHVELYHPTLIFYLRSDIVPKIAVQLFRLIETNYFFSENEEIRLVLKHASYIKQDHWAILSERRFASDAKRLKLLKIIPVKEAFDLIERTFKETEKNFARFVPFYLNAISSLEWNGENYKKLRELLKDVVRNNQSKVLDEIPEQLRQPLYRELILAGYETKGGSKLSFSHAKLSDLEKGNEKGFALPILIGRAEDAFFESTSQLPQNVQTFVVDEIIDILEKGRCSWSVLETLKSFERLPYKTRSLYISVIHFLVRTPDNYKHLSKYPFEFKQFLLQGFENFFWDRKDRTQPRRPDGKVYSGSQVSLLKLLASLGKEKIIGPLRDACLEVSRPLSIENIEFGSWWLLNELLYLSDEILEKDYLFLINEYRKYSKNELPKNVDDKALFILTGRQSAEKWSLIACYRKSDEISDQNFVRQRGLLSLINIWAEQKITICLDDINFLIDLLPDRKANDILAKLVQIAGKEQKSVFLHLKVNRVQRWLIQTASNRTIYKANNNDLLFELFLDIKDPSIEFIRYMLIDDPGAYMPGSSWISYTQSIYERQWKLSFNDSFLNDYFILAREIADVSGNGMSYIASLKTLLEFDVKDIQPSQWKESTLKTLLNLTFVNKTLTKNIQSKIEHILMVLLRQPYLFDLLERFEPNTILGLTEYYEQYLKENRIMNAQLTSSIYAERTQKMRDLFQRLKNGKNQTGNQSNENLSLEEILWGILKLLIVIVAILGVLYLLQILFP